MKVKVKLTPSAGTKDQKYRARLKEDPERYEVYLRKARDYYRRKKEEGTIKSIEQCNDREKRKRRRGWKTNQKICRENKKKAQAMTPPPSPSPNSSPQAGPSDGHSNRGRKQARKNRDKARRTITQLEAALAKKQRNIKRLQKQLERQRKVKEKRGKVVRKEILRKYKLKQNTRGFWSGKVRSFLLREDNSRTMPGKKQCVTKHGVKKQVQVLAQSMKVSHEKFCSEYPEDHISYAVFCCHRPFWVKLPTLGARETCACKKHENLQFQANVLYRAKVLNSNDLNKLATHLCCSTDNKNCAYRKCNACSRKQLPLPTNYDTIKNDTCTWYTWKTISTSYSKKGESFNTKRVMKINEKGTIDDLLNSFQGELTKSIVHFYNIAHQYKSLHELKSNIGPTEVVVHIDFSENYLCKGFRVIQQAHFGSTHQQVSLHTGIVYTANDIWTFCTFSQSLQHDAPAIWCHIDPILKEIKKADDRVNTIHFVSDGPATQYRCKTNFYLATTLTYDYGFDNMTWNFMESGHGKGPADGVGGTVKRTADSLVAQGADITNGTQMFNLLVQNDTTGKIKKFLILGEEIHRLEESIVDKKLIKAYPGTMKVHQLSSTSTTKGAAYFRDVSCFCKTNPFLICECYDNNFFRLAQGSHANSAISPATVTSVTGVTPEDVPNVVPEDTPRVVSEDVQSVVSADVTSVSMGATNVPADVASVSMDAPVYVASVPMDVLVDVASVSMDVTDVPEDVNSVVPMSVTNAPVDVASMVREETPRVLPVDVARVVIVSSATEYVTMVPIDVTSRVKSVVPEDMTSVSEVVTTVVPSDVSRVSMDVTDVHEGVNSVVPMDATCVSVASEVREDAHSVSEVVASVVSELLAMVVPKDATNVVAVDVTGVVHNVAIDPVTSVSNVVSCAVDGVCDDANVMLTSADIGRWCTVNYDGETYPGILNAIDEQEREVEVNTMCPSRSDRYYWPDKKDMIWYKYADFRGFIKEPVHVTGRLLKLQA